MGIWEILGGIAGIVTIIWGIIAALNAICKWAKSKRSIKRKPISVEGSKYYRDLSNEEVIVLLSALASTGIIKIIETDQTGKFLQIGDRDFYDIERPDIRISYLETLRKLIEKGLVFEENERWFNLTKTGYEYAHDRETKDLMEKAWKYYENKKDYLKSIEIYREVVRKYSNSEIAKEAQIMIGVNFLHLEDPINAEVELKKALDMGNDFSSAYFYYGEALLNNKKYKEAKIAYEASLCKPDAPKWIKSTVPGKIMLCQKRKIPILTALTDEKYEIEKDKIEKEIPLQEANLKEKTGLRGLRHSSPLARELFELNLNAAKRKIELRLKLDKEIIILGNKIKTDEDIHLIMNRLRTVANAEKMALKEKIILVYKECHTNGLIDADMRKIDQEIETLLKEMHTNLLIEKERL